MPGFLQKAPRLPKRHHAAGHNQSNRQRRSVEVFSTGEALKMMEHMEAIATFSKKQSLELADVNKAINEMDQVTHQNAAMVEQTNTVSTTLAQESTKLKSMIDQFSLPRSHAAQKVAAGVIRSPTTDIPLKVKLAAAGDIFRR